RGYIVRRGHRTDRVGGPTPASSRGRVGVAMAQMMMGCQARGGARAHGATPGGAPGHAAASPRARARLNRMPCGLSAHASIIPGAVPQKAEQPCLHAFA